jgi:hypothetical protein
LRWLPRADARGYCLAPLRGWLPGAEGFGGLLCPPAERAGYTDPMLTPKRAAVVLRWLLILNGIMTLCALPAVCMPIPWMDMFHRNLGLGPLPEGPIVQYLARSVSALYAAFGSLTLILSLNLERYAPLITWWGITAVVFGALLLWVDLNAPMPAHWTWSEVPYSVLTGAVVLLLQCRRRRPSRSAD